MTPSDQVRRQLLRRNLASFSVSRIPHRFTDVLILGSGMAGLSAALAAVEDEEVEVLLATKTDLNESATRYAQGGIAAVVDPELTDDSPERHVEDTRVAAAGLSDEEIVRLTVNEGIERVRQLSELGVNWDRDENGAIRYTIEGGHSRPRILHRGDTTGQEIQRVLVDAVSKHPGVTILDHTFAVDLLTEDGVAKGALMVRPHGDLEAVWARRTILATGGIGRLYRETTNPAVATGDGIALAFRAGAVVQDLEFVQFHPTTLYMAGADRFLITEAARGEGGVLVDAVGHRFMPRFHRLADLAPRDIVSRAISTVMRETGSNRVFLDLSPIEPERIRLRFPRILEKLKGFGIDILREPIPVRPSAHYSIGGVRTDAQARTTVEGLFAAGEVAATGLHGANRLASNSLLEGLVFGHRAGKLAGQEARDTHLPRPFSVTSAAEPLSVGAPLDLDDLTTSLRSLLWQKVGLERDGEDLRSAFQQICSWIPYGLGRQFHEARSWGVQNMLLVAFLLTHSADQRRESRGVHFRVDYPETDDENWQRHVLLERQAFAQLEF